MKVNIETSHGLIVADLDEERAPNTTANFLAYADAGFYDETLFHRVISGFMIQGGGFEPGMSQKGTLFDPIDNEADNRVSNESGTLAMARTPDPHSATAQFFINTNDNDFLDFREPTQEGWGYCVFGRVVDGMDVVGRIEEVSTGSRAGHRDVPVEDVVIRRVLRAD